jgi:hypothetical protein
MQKRLMVQRAEHAPEPEPGSFRAVTGDGDDADLFNLNHYPVHAVCRVCSEPIRAEAFLHAFRHQGLQPRLAGDEGQAVTGQRGGQ